MKDLILKDSHIAMSGKMVEFAGFNMPVSFAGLIEEHNTVRNGVGVFDVSHMGEFFVKGPNAFDLVQKITSNDAAVLFDSKIMYSTLPNGKGGIVDDLLVYRIAKDNYLLVVNGANVDKDWAWVNSQNSMGAELTNESDDYCLFAVQGPKSADALQSLTKTNMHDMVYYTFEIGVFAGVNDVIISATGYTGSGGFEIYVKNADAKQVFDAIFESGKEQGIAPIGLGARDTLRLEKGFCLYGNDIDDTTSPLEAGLGWVTKFVDGNEFVDRNFLAAQKEAGLNRRLAGFEMLERGIPRHGYTILNMDGEEIGQVTSGTQSPSLNKAIGLGYINVPNHKKGTEIQIQIRKKTIKAQVVGIPFLK